MHLFSIRNPLFTQQKQWNLYQNKVASSLALILKALAKEDTLLRTHCCQHKMFPHLPVRTTFVADTNFVSGTQKMFLILFRNILCLQQMFPSLHSPRNIMGNNVSSFTTALRPDHQVKNCKMAYLGSFHVTLTFQTPESHFADKHRSQKKSVTLWEM